MGATRRAGRSDSLLLAAPALRGALRARRSAGRRFAATALVAGCALRAVGRRRSPRREAPDPGVAAADVLRSHARRWLRDGRASEPCPGDYLGLDTDTAAVARARRRYRCDARKRFLIADAAVMEFPPNFFDVGLVHGIAEPSRASLDAIARATQGPIVLVQPARASLESLRASLAHAGLGVDCDEVTREHRILLCRRGAVRR